jgi:hypothetical protein
MVFRLDPAAHTGTYDTSDTAGPSARYGTVKDISVAQPPVPADDVPDEPAGTAG